MNKTSSGKVWPYIIGGSIVMVFGFCVATIITTSQANIQESNAYMTSYQEADAKANDYIKDRIAFDKELRISYVQKKLNQAGSTIEYKIVDKNNNPINNATLEVFISRPETHKYDQKLQNPVVENGIYKFKDIKFEKAGIYNLIARVKVGDLQRFYNVKVDTRYEDAVEFE